MNERVIINERVVRTAEIRRSKRHRDSRRTAEMGLDVVRVPCAQTRRAGVYADDL